MNIDELYVEADDMTSNPAPGSNNGGTDQPDPKEFDTTQATREIDSSMSNINNIDIGDVSVSSEAFANFDVTQFTKLATDLKNSHGDQFNITRPTQGMGGAQQFSIQDPDSPSTSFIKVTMDGNKNITGMQTVMKKNKWDEIIPETKVLFKGTLSRVADLFNRISSILTGGPNAVFAESVLDYSIDEYNVYSDDDDVEEVEESFKNTPKKQYLPMNIAKLGLKIAELLTDSLTAAGYTVPGSGVSKSTYNSKGQLEDVNPSDMRDDAIDKVSKNIEHARVVNDQIKSTMHSDDESKLKFSSKEVHAFYKNQKDLINKIVDLSNISMKKMQELGSQLIRGKLNVTNLKRMNDEAAKLEEVCKQYIVDSKKLGDTAKNAAFNEYAIYVEADEELEAPEDIETTEEVEAGSDDSLLETFDKEDDVKTQSDFKDDTPSESTEEAIENTSDTIEDIQDTTESIPEPEDPAAGDDDSVDAPTEKPTEDFTVDDDLSIGTDNSPEQNEYDPKEVEQLTKLIASENDAIGEYFDAAKNSRDSNLMRLYSDIGGEERFHVEQLTYAKAQLTGEPYEPKDPDVKKEYEELLAMGMDEETAMTTAVDKVGLAPGPVEASSEKSFDEITDEMDFVESMLFQNAFATCIMECTLDESLDNINKFIDVFVENYQIYQEDFNGSGTRSARENERWTAGFLISKMVGFIRSMLKKVREAVSNFNAKVRHKRAKILDWVEENGIQGLFKDGIPLYFYNNNVSGGHFAHLDLLEYVKVLHNTLVDFGEFDKKKDVTFNGKQLTKFTAKQYKGFDYGYRVITNGPFSRLETTKVVADEANKNALIAAFFGYNDQQTIDNKSMNFYNTLEYCLNLINDDMAAVEMIDQTLSDRTSGSAVDATTYTTGGQKTMKGSNEMKNIFSVIVKAYRDVLAAITHDINQVMKLNGEVANQTASLDEQRAGNKHAMKHTESLDAKEKKKGIFGRLLG